LAVPRLENSRALASVVVGFLGVLTVPFGVLLAELTKPVTLLNSGTGSIPATLLLGISAIVLARRGREESARRVVHATGRRAAVIGRVLGVASICLATSAALAVGFYGLLTLFTQ
jgi:hypothetical protein